jgi:hypothetical protein
VILDERAGEAGVDPLGEELQLGFASVWSCPSAHGRRWRGSRSFPRESCTYLYAIFDKVNELTMGIAAVAPCNAGARIISSPR